MGATIQGVKYLFISDLTKRWERNHRSVQKWLRNPVIAEFVTAQKHPIDGRRLMFPLEQIEAAEKALDITPAL